MAFSFNPFTGTLDVVSKAELTEVEANALYLRLDGTTTMAGNIAMGDNDITGANIITGTTDLTLGSSGGTMILSDDTTDQTLTFNLGITNFAGGTTYDFSADINVTGDVGGTTIGGITEANLVDKTATEAISGAWTHSTALTMNGANIVMGDNSVTGIDTLTFTDVDGTIAGIANKNLLDKTAAEEISGVWEIQDDINLAFGNDADVTMVFDEATDDQFIVSTAKTTATADTDPLFLYLVPAGVDSGQEIFGIGVGAQTVGGNRWKLTEAGATTQIESGTFGGTGQSTLTRGLKLNEGGGSDALSDFLWESDAIDPAVHFDADVPAAIFAIPLYFTQTDGNERIDSENDGYMDYRATTAHRFRIGAIEQVLIENGAFYPKTDNDIDLGKSGNEFKNLFIDGKAEIDEMDVGDGTNETRFATDGLMVMAGTARVEKEMRLDIAGTGGGSTKPTLDQSFPPFDGWEFDIDDDIHYVFEVPSDADTTMPIEIHIHWFIDEARTGANEEVNWQIIYRSVKEDGTEPVDSGGSTATISSGDTLIPSTSKALLETAVGVIIADNIDQDDVIGVDLSRIALVDGTDPTNDPIIIAVEVHYTANKLGTGL